jgi:hypothetical protein
VLTGYAAIWGRLQELREREDGTAPRLDRYARAQAPR